MKMTQNPQQTKQKRCPKCHTKNRDTATFCVKCGEPLTSQTTCYHCGASVEAQATFCQRCGGHLRSNNPSRRPITGMLSAQTVLAEKYVILEKVGQGGMGAVYRVTELNDLGIEWAIKELSDAAITNPMERQQAAKAYRREVDLLSRLHHPNLPKIIDSFSQDSKKYLVMEFIPGETLEQRLLRTKAPIPWDEVLPWAIQLCDVLSYLHNQSPPIIFRDLKPDNVMVTPQGQIKLIDFGIARLFKPGKSKDTIAFGTAGYAPPEQHGQGQTDARSDIYALGATLHRLITNTDPQDNPFIFVPPKQLCTDLPNELDRAITKALEMKKSERWQDISTFKAALERVHIPPPSPKPAQKKPKPSPRRQPTLSQKSKLRKIALWGGLLLLAMACLSSLVLIILSFSGGDEPFSQTIIKTTPVPPTQKTRTIAVTPSPTATQTPIASSTPLPIHKATPTQTRQSVTQEPTPVGSSIVLIEPETKRSIKWGATVTFRWKWDGKLQDDEYLELRINDRWYETVTRPYAGQIQVKLDKLEAGNYTWSIVLMSRANRWPVQQSEKRPFTID